MWAGVTNSNKAVMGSLEFAKKNIDRVTAVIVVMEFTKKRNVRSSNLLIANNSSEFKQA